ncbi:unnamed protein product [Amoebophrya sp. A120]|nr:unnamed protein product [Amoebophrya sp. A120]|eukprot:GSA120T00012384001.1
MMKPPSVSKVLHKGGSFSTGRTPATSSGTSGTSRRSGSAMNQSDLKELWGFLKSLKPTVRRGTYVFATLPLEELEKIPRADTVCEFKETVDRQAVAVVFEKDKAEKHAAILQQNQNRAAGTKSATSIGTTGNVNEKSGATTVAEEGILPSAEVEEPTAIPKPKTLLSPLEACWIQLEATYSAAESIGLTAVFSRALAQANISCNIISGFYHDHLFIAKQDEEKAVVLLEAMSRFANHQQFEVLSASGPDTEDNVLAESGRDHEASLEMEKSAEGREDKVVKNAVSSSTSSSDNINIKTMKDSLDVIVEQEETNLLHRGTGSRKSSRGRVVTPTPDGSCVPSSRSSLLKNENGKLSGTSNSRHTGNINTPAGGTAVPRSTRRRSSTGRIAGTTGPHLGAPAPASTPAGGVA